MAAPHACGVAALLESSKPSLTGPQKFSLMVPNTKPYNDTRYLGSGILNAKKALDAALNGGGNTPPAVASKSAVANEDTAVTVTLDGTDAEQCELGFSIVSGPPNGKLGSPGLGEPFRFPKPTQAFSRADFCQPGYCLITCLGTQSGHTQNSGPTKYLRSVICLHWSHLGL